MIKYLVHEGERGIYLVVELLQTFLGTNQNQQLKQTTGSKSLLLQFTTLQSTMTNISFFLAQFKNFKHSNIKFMKDSQLWRRKEKTYHGYDKDFGLWSSNFCKIGKDT